MLLLLAHFNSKMTRPNTHMQCFPKHGNSTRCAPHPKTLNLILKKTTFPPPHLTWIPRMFVTTCNDPCPQLVTRKMDNKMDNRQMHTMQISTISYFIQVPLCSYKTIPANSPKLVHDLPLILDAPPVHPHPPMPLPPLPHYQMQWLIIFVLWLQWQIYPLIN